MSETDLQVETLFRDLREARRESAKLRRRISYLEELLDAWQEAGSEAMRKLDPLVEDHPLSRLFSRVCEATVRAQKESLAELQDALGIAPATDPSPDPDSEKAPS